MGPIRLVEKKYRVVCEERSVGHKLPYRALETKGEDTLSGFIVYKGFGTFSHISAGLFSLSSYGSSL